MLENIYKTKQKRNYVERRFPVVDTSSKSPYYFNIEEVPSLFTAGKNVIKLGVDGIYLKRDYQIDLEVLDVNGEPLYNEYTGFRDRYGYHYYIVYVYDKTPVGIGNITFVGVADRDLQGNTLSYVGSEHEQQFNIRWSKSVNIKATDRNLSDIIFQRAPDVTITQVLTPYKFNFGTYALNSRLATQSLAGISIYTSENAGIDFVENTSENILDLESVNNSYNYFLKSSTANTVRTNIRAYDNDITNGYIYSEFSRYNTYVYDPLGRLSKDMEGSIFTFFNDDSGGSMLYSWSYNPIPSSSTIQITPSGSLATQLTQYKPKIVYVLNQNYALLEKPVTVTVTDSQNTEQPIDRAFTIKQVSNATGSFLYPSSSNLEVQSTNLSSSYIQFTFLDLNPIVGDVYRIKTFAKEAGRNTEYFQLNDHIVKSPEFLVDTDKQNQAVYAKNKSDFFTYGEFTDINIVTDYWRGFSFESTDASLQGTSLYQYSLNPSSSTVLTHVTLSNALTIPSVRSVRRGITSRYYQTYIPDQPYSISFYCSLDPGCELEVYMSSTPLKDNVIGLQAPRAFNQTRDPETVYSKLGKLIGKISNASGSVLRHYNNVVFDFYPDTDGFGRPVFFLNTNKTTTTNAYISSISITPLDLVGYTPSILQFAAATPDSINILQDDDASLTQSLDVKIEYFTADGRQSEYTTYVPNLQINMINEVPGFCSSEASKFNNQAPFYYEVGTSSLSKPNSGTASLTPTLWSDKFFWPTFSLNDYGGYYWNMRSFTITGSNYNTLQLTRPVSASITSSWFRYDPILPLYTVNVPTGNNSYDSFKTMYSGTVAPVTYSSSPIDGNMFSSLTTDRKFYDGTGVAIDKYEIAASQSLLMYYSNSYTIQSDPTKLQNLQTYLRKTRLYYPATSSTYVYGFHENGGIYNVRFKLSKVPTFNRTSGFFSIVLNYPDNGLVVTSSAGSEVAGVGYSKTSTRDKYSPDTGAKLMVYIADVATPLSNAALVPGREGFFPPTNNIVTIGNGYNSITPTIRFYDSGSGYNIDQYDLVLVQYGEKAQLVFDASGLELELDTNPSVPVGTYKIYNNISQSFWGGVISDIEWCKIGITTDPRFVKPSDFDTAFNTFVPYNPPPLPGPPSDPSEGQQDLNQKPVD
jgi:hypothetical protein